MRGWRGAVLRPVLGRLRIDEDILRHLSTFQRLGATMEVAPPAEAMPIGARTVLRAVRTRGAVEIAADWLWPRWIEQQLDPDNPAFTARGHLPTMQNVTLRNWTLVGNPGSEWEAIVDPSGLVTPRFDGWSLDWWIHDGQRWRFPSREPELRQGLVDAAPVVATTLPVPGGTVVHHAYTVECVPELVVVEIANRADHDVQVALAVRPYNPEGLAVVEQVTVAGDRVTVDGHLAVSLPGEPDVVVASTFAAGDGARSLAVGGGHPPPAQAACRSGLAQLACVFGLPAGQRLRAAVPVSARGPRARLGLPWRRRMRAVLPDPGPLPSAEEVAHTWQGRRDRGLRVHLPAGALAEAVQANRAFLLLLHDPGSITAGPFTYHRFWFRDAAYQVAALDRWGFHDEAADVLASYPGRQRPDGFFHSQWREWDANGAAIWTIAEHDRLTGDEALLHELAPAVERGARWLADTCADDRGKDPAAHGLLPAGISAEHLGPFDHYYWDDLWGLRGLLDAAALARRRDQPELARTWEAAARRLRTTLFDAIARSAQRTGRDVITAGPTRGEDPGMIGGLAACYPLGLLAPEHPWIAGTVAAIRERFTIGQAFFQGIAHTGLGTYLTLQLAFVELLAGDPRALARLRWLLEAASATWTWPEAIHPRLDGGCMGDGHHGWMAAELLSFVRTLLVREADDGLALVSLLPREWVGASLAVRDAPTHHGLVSYELDWDGPVCELRWERERGGVPLRAPGLDPDWSTLEASGRARFTPGNGC